MSDKESHVTKSDMTILGGVNRTDDLPSNRQVRFTPKSPVRFTPPKIAKSDLPSNRQVRFTPQIVCTIYPPKIAKSDLPSNRQVQFTAQIICTIYPPRNRTDDLPSNRQVRFTPKLPVRFTPPPNRPILSKISNAHNIMLCFTKVFSAKDQLWTGTVCELLSRLQLWR